MPGFLVATRKGLFRIERGPSGWDVVAGAFLGDHVSIVVRDPRDGAIYAGLKHGHFGSKMHVARRGDFDFAPIGVPEYPEPPAGWTEPPNPFSGKAVPWSLEMIWELQPGGADQPGRLWCGTLPGGLFRSDDAGATWMLVRSLWDHPSRTAWFGGGYDVPGLHSVCVDPRDSRSLLVGVSCGGAWRSDDDGASWRSAAKGMRAEYMPPDRAHEEAAQDPHLLARCRARPDVIWTQHHNGIFRSTDHASTWHELDRATPSAFGFAVAAHPHDPETAWFVPAIKDEKRIPVDGALCVVRTRDGGRTFEARRKGLPQRHCYDLVFRHALAVDDDGAVLAFGSTTGAVWISEDGGDAWTLVTAHLPPVHAVRLDR